MWWEIWKPAEILDEISLLKSTVKSAVKFAEKYSVKYAPEIKSHDSILRKYALCEHSSPLAAGAKTKKIGKGRLLAD